MVWLVMLAGCMQSLCVACHGSAASTASACWTVRRHGAARGWAALAVPGGAGGCSRDAAVWPPLLLVDTGWPQQGGVQHGQVGFI